MSAGTMTSKQRKQMQIAEEAWLDLGDTSGLIVPNNLIKKSKKDVEEPHIHLLKIIRDPANFAFTCKHVLNVELFPFQLAILNELWYKPFPMLIGCRGAGKSFMLALYSVLRALVCQGTKVVMVGSGFRQSKILFEYAAAIWNNAPILRDLCGAASRRDGIKLAADRCELKVGMSTIIAIPLGDGTKIRGLRANVIIADEFASISLPVFENVVIGFASVNMSPVDKVKMAAKRKSLRKQGLMAEAVGTTPSIPGLNSNQTIVSGTAYFGFNHFCSYWKKYKAIIESKGDMDKLEQIFNGEIPEKFNHRDYSVIRLPVELLPEDLMDTNTVAKAKATIASYQYDMEYAACFASDSNGFFKRSLIESCVVGNPSSPIYLPEVGTVNFSAVMRGDLSRRYVMAIDPASENDNFSIVVLELWADHRRIVHCWTTTRKRHKAKVAKGLTKEDDFYGFAARRIRDLLKLFPCERIAIDSQGGGVAVMEALQSSKNIQPGELAILPIIVEGEEKESDRMSGLHIIEPINFAKSDWVSWANHGMRQDFENKTLLFPAVDSAELGMAVIEDELMMRKVRNDDGEYDKVYDTLEDCILEIEELKDELATITHTQTGKTLRDRWDTPDTKLPGGKKGKLRKDRYSSLLMANAIGRFLQSQPIGPQYACMGGFAHDLAKMEDAMSRTPGHQNPSWYTEVINDPGYGAIARRTV